MPSPAETASSHEEARAFDLSTVPPDRLLALLGGICAIGFGALPGLIAGILGLVGAPTGIVRNLKFMA